MGTKTERIYKIEQMIRYRSGVTFEDMLDELEVSPATLKRDLQFLRDRLGAPIEFQRDDKTYRFGPEFRGQKHELPGLWFDQKELYSLLMSYQLLSGLDPDGILSRHVSPLLDRIHQLLGSNEVDSSELMRRVRIVSSAKRAVPSQFFELIATALLQRKRIQIQYYTRSRKAVSERELSPLRLIHYRNTWYLDAWCHKSDDMRRFALDAVQAATALETKAKDVSLKRVEQELDGGYGIFAGNKVKWATLLFTADAAQWVAKEEWHPQQEVTPLDDGRLQMKLPFVDPTELLMDVMRFGPDVELVEPQDLRHALIDRLHKATRQYQDR